MSHSNKTKSFLGNRFQLAQMISVCGSFENVTFIKEHD